MDNWIAKSHIRQREKYDILASPDFWPGLVSYLLYGPCIIVPHKWTNICWLATEN